MPEIPTLNFPQPVIDAITALSAAAADDATKTQALTTADGVLSDAQTKHTTAAEDKAKSRQALETAKAALKTAIDQNFPT